MSETLKEICKELDIFWTDDPKELQNFIINKYYEDKEKEQRRKDC